MPFRLLRALGVAAALGTVVSTVPSIAVDFTGVTPTSSHQGRPSVVELDLAGVRADAIPSLPSPDSVPLEGGPAATTVRPAAAALAGTGNLPQVRPHPRMLTAKLDTKPFTVLGVTWDLTHGLGDVVIRYGAPVRQMDQLAWGERI